MKIKYLLLFTYLIAFCTSQTFAQKFFTVKYIYTDTVKGKGFYFKYLNPFNKYPSETIKEYQVVNKIDTIVNKKYITEVKYKVNNLSQAIIGDGYGHNSFIIPQDTVTILFKKMKKVDGMYLLNEKYPATWFNDFEYQGKNKYTYALFDSLAYQTGLLDLPPIKLSEVKSGLQKYFDTVVITYKNRIDYIKMYANRHHISPQILKYAISEVYMAHINNLLEPIASPDFSVTEKDYSKPILTLLSNAEFSDPELFKNTLSYRITAYKYIYLYKFKLMQWNYGDDEKFTKIYEYISKNYANNEMKNFFLASHLVANISNKIPSFDFFYKKFIKNSKDSSLRMYLDSVYNKQKEGWKITLEDALMAQIYHETDTISLKSLLIGKPTVIDCWASWCIPCLQQMPFSKKLNDEFKDSVQFVYLSFDKNMNAFLNKSSSLKIKSIMLKNNFQSQFAKHFGIFSIPRYLIFDRHGNLVSDNAPRPSKRNDMKEILLKLVK